MFEEKINYTDSLTSNWGSWNLEDLEEVPYKVGLEINFMKTKVLHRENENGIRRMR